MQNHFQKRSTLAVSSPPPSAGTALEASAISRSVLFFEGAPSLKTGRRVTRRDVGKVSEFRVDHRLLAACPAHTHWDSPARQRCITRGARSCARDGERRRRGDALLLSEKSLHIA
jgi:hypothetical protein